jgi:hypothetical protein
MGDVTEIQALQASLRGARGTAAQLADIATRIEASDARQEISESDLDELRRLTSANALAAQALRGLVETMLKRRGMVQEVAATTGASEDE